MWNFNKDKSACFFYIFLQLIKLYSKKIFFPSILGYFSSQFI